LQSWSLVIRAAGPKRRGAARLQALARAFRGLPIPVIGRLQDGALVFDLRCLEDEAAFLAQLERLVIAAPP
jgi:L-seryl-tRNA(Ser) seleniumtransferase